MVSAWRVSVVALVALSVGCGVVLGFEDKELASDAPDAATTDARPDVDPNDGGVEAAAPSVFAKPVVLTTGQNGPRGLTLSASHVIWTNFEGNSIARAPRNHDGTIVTPFTGADQPAPLDVVAYGTNTAWLRTADGYVVFASGGQYRNCGTGLRLTQDANDLWYTELCPESNLWRVPKASPSTRAVAAQSPASDPYGALASDGLSVYVAKKTAIVVIGDPDAGARTFAVTTGVVTVDLIAGDTAVFWLGGDGTVNRLAKTDVAKPPKVIASGQAGLARLALFAGELFWTAGGGGGATGKIVRAPADGSRAPDVLAEGQNEPFGIAADATGVYWANHGDGKIMKLPRAAP